MKAPATAEPCDPAQFPWVVRLTYQTSQVGCHGWASRVLGSYDNEAEARAVWDAPLGRGELDRELLKWELRSYGRPELKLVGIRKRKKLAKTVPAKMV
jgi:hypothetical protein